MESAKPPIWIRVLPKLKQDKFYMELHRRQKAVEMHDHAFLELTYILEGEVEHTLDGQTSRLCRGDYLIVDYGSRHAYSAVGAEGFDNLDCLFLPELLDPVLKGSMKLYADACDLLAYCVKELDAYKGRITDIHRQKLEKRGGESHDK